MIRPALRSDADAIAHIYNHYVLHTIVTFEEEAISISEIIRRMADVTQESLPWLVAEEDGRVVGYAYATPWKSRRAYRFSVEATVYLDPDCKGRGVGSELYGALFTLLGDRGDIHGVMGGIALPNDASVALHERLGMKKVAHLSEVGFKFGQWIDVGYWQFLI